MDTDDLVDARHRAIVDAELARCLDDSAVVAVFLAGPWARGPAIPDADIDLGAIVSSEEESGFGYYEVDELAVAVLRMTAEEARLRITASAKYLAGYLEGKPLHDPDGELERLQEFARGQLAETPPLEVWWYWLSNLRGKLSSARAAEDYVRAAVALDVRKILEGVWLAHGEEFPGSPGAVIEHLADLSEPPSLAHDVDVLMNGDIEDRVDTAIDLLDWVLPRLDDSGQKHQQGPGGD